MQVKRDTPLPEVYQNYFKLSGLASSICLCTLRSSVACCNCASRSCHLLYCQGCMPRYLSSVNS